MIITLIPIIISFISLIISILSYIKSTKVSDLDYKIKTLKLSELEEEQANKQKPFIEARIVKETDGKYKLRVFNSGDATEYEIFASIDEESKIMLYNTVMPFEKLDPGNSFDDLVIYHLGSSRKYTITTKWKDDAGAEFEDIKVRTV